MVNREYKSTPKNAKNIVLKAVVFPLVAGIAIALLALFVGFGGSFFDVPNGTPVAYFDGENDNSVFAEIDCGDNQIPVLHGDEYSFLDDGACYKKGSLFGEVGVGYYLALDNKIKPFAGKNVTVSVDGETYSYRCTGKLSAKNENEVLNHIFNASKGFVLYTQNAEKYGFSKGYTAYFYEEVAE